MKLSAGVCSKVLGLAVLLTIVGCGGGRPTSQPGSDGVFVAPPVIPDTDPIGVTHRYAFANQCFVLKSNSAQKYLEVAGSGYAATADDIANAVAFFLKPSALGEYLLFRQIGSPLGATQNLVSAASTPVGNVALASATDDAIFVLKVRGDGTNYPIPPDYDMEPAKDLLQKYRNFVDKFITGSEFVITVKSSGMALAVNASGSLITQVAANGPTESFSFERLEVTSCSIFPEALSNIAGELESPLGLKPSFSGKAPDNESVLGHADVHVHWSSSTFLGNAQSGDTFHKYGVTHALEDCEEQHGPGGERDGTGAVLSGSGGGNPQHFTDGWPTFTDWPGRDRLTHEAMYWKWVERAWQAGLRIMVNDLVDNETLCELTRSINEQNDPNGAGAQADCNSMKSAKDQIGTMYALQDYIDAQYGGRGKGFMRIVLDPVEARAEVEKGNLAVVLGLEISNTLNCKVIYSSGRILDAFEETGAGGTENRYTCTTEESGDGNHPEGSVMYELTSLWDLGVRQFISIHEFDNAFGGNGVFFDVLNAGNMENSGGVRPDQVENAGAFGNLDQGTGEFWSTYTCPENDAEDFSGYFWGDKGGTQLPGPNPPGPGCPGPYAGQIGYTDEGLPVKRPGGTTLCYPSGQLCNARWMTPIGLYTFRKLMHFGFIFDFDHFELEMKDQILELAEEQPKGYPFVSTHGTFGGISNNQARRVFANGGFLYPSIGSSNSFLNDMNETKAIYEEAMNDTFMQGLGLKPTILEDAEKMFAFGYGTDTNGLSSQSGPRGEVAIADRPVGYPYMLFKDDSTVCEPSDTNTCINLEPFWGLLPEFAGRPPEIPAHPGVIFEQPAIYDPANPANAAGNFTPQRTWHEDIDGNAHYGMFSGMVQELRLAEFDADTSNREELVSPTVAMQHLFNSAELYLRVWERTVAASQAIRDLYGDAGPKLPAETEDYQLLRPAPIPNPPPSPPF